MKGPIMPMNSGEIINDFNYKNKVIPNHNHMRREDLDENEKFMNYNKNIRISQEPNNYINNENIIASTQNVIEQNDFMNMQCSVNNYQKILQDFQYLNALLNRKNLALENELSLLKNKYNDTKLDIDDINKHILICKENQEKIISDLTEKNNYLENILSKKVNDNNKNMDENNKEILNNKNNINLNLFIYKMKKIFKNNIEMNDEIKDEDYLNIISNNIIQLNDELIKCKKDIEQKDFEINNLKNENKSLKLKIQQINYNNKQSINVSKEYSSNYFNSSTDCFVEKKPRIVHNNLINLTNDNISDFLLKDNYSNYSGQIKRPNFQAKFTPFSHSPLRNNFINNLSRTPLLENLKKKTYNINNNNNNNNNNIHFNKKYGFTNNNNEKRLINSRSYGSLKIKSLNQFNNNNDMNTMDNYMTPKVNLVNQQCINSKNSLQCLMNNVAQLETALKNTQNNIDVNPINNFNC
jgi:hypothetical protein